MSEQQVIEQNENCMMNDNPSHRRVHMGKVHHYQRVPVIKAQKNIYMEA
jgi:hypothetical protein